MVTEDVPVFLGVVVTVTDAGGAAVFAAHIPDDDEGFNALSLVSIDGLKSAGIKIRIGLAGSITSPVTWVKSI